MLQKAVIEMRSTGIPVPGSGFAGMTPVEEDTAFAPGDIAAEFADIFAGIDCPDIDDIGIGRAHGKAIDQGYQVGLGSSQIRARGFETEPECGPDTIEIKFLKIGSWNRASRDASRPSDHSAHLHAETCNAKFLGIDGEADIDRKLTAKFPISEHVAARAPGHEITGERMSRIAEAGCRKPGFQRLFYTHLDAVASRHTNSETHF